MSTKSLGQSLYEFAQVFEHLAEQAKERGDEDFLKICTVIRSSDVKYEDLKDLRVKKKKSSAKRGD